MTEAEGPIAQDTAAIDLQFSTVKGFRLQDFDTRCSVAPERRCPAKVTLVSQYTLNAVKGDDGLPEDAYIDRDICVVKLNEYQMWARRDECGEAVANSCPTRERMDESVVRKTGVSAARKIMGLLGIRGH
jgi:hypothetical protein